MDEKFFTLAEMDRIRDAAYDEGFNDGYRKGFTTGHSDGHEEGWFEGKEYAHSEEGGSRYVTTIRI